MKKEKKLIYKPPQATISLLGNGLSLMEAFSSNGDGLDWNEGELLPNELDDDVLGDDWNKGGFLGTD